MITMNMLEAKTNLSKLVEAIEGGAEKEIVIARNGRPAARIVPLNHGDASVLIGVAEGQFSFNTEAFGALDKEMAGLFGIPPVEEMPLP